MPTGELNIAEIRNRLGELPFRDGIRQVWIANISDQVGFIDQASIDADQDADAEQEEREQTEGDAALAARQEAIETYLSRLRAELARHDLELARGQDDPDRLYAAQRLRVSSDVDLSWMSAAMSWAYRIMAVALSMALPVIMGAWLDARLRTNYLALLGVVLGLAMGLWQLVQLSRGMRDRHTSAHNR